jgi:hypothetical protein
MKKLAVLTMLVMGAVAYAAVYPEAESNDSKAAANVIAGLVAGDQIQGNSTSSSGVGLDYFRASTAAAPLAIYRHRLVLTSATTGHTATIRGLNQTGALVDTMPGLPWDGVVGTAGTTDSAAQTASSTTTPPRFVQWYGFGKSEQIYYRVTGTGTTVVDYFATLETTTVTPTDIGSYAPGSIQLTTLGQGHTTDTDMWVYDGNLNAMTGYGNDDEAPNAVSGGPGTGSTLQSFFARDYAPGVYYLAISNFNLANNQASPSDDDFRTGTLLDFPDAVTNSSTSANLNLTFRITDSAGTTLQVPNTKVGAFDINWFKFTVTPEPSSLALLGLAGLLIRRR